MRQWKKLLCIRWNPGSIIFNWFSFQNLSINKIFLEFNWLEKYNNWAPSEIGISLQLDRSPEFEVLNRFYYKIACKYSLWSATTKSIVLISHLLSKNNNRNSLIRSKTISIHLLMSAFDFFWILYILYTE